MRKLTLVLMLVAGMLWGPSGAFALELMALLQPDVNAKGPVQSMASHKLIGDALPIAPARPMMDNLKRADSATKVRVDKSFGKLPLRFEKNDGQTADEVKFFSRGKGYTMYLTPTESVMALTRVVDAPKAKHEPAKTETSVVRMEVVGGNPKANISGEEQLPGTSNYFVGNDKSKWRQAVPNYAKVRYEEVYPGIDLVYYGNQRKLEYDFVVKPGADPKQIALKFKGTENLSINPAGDLVLKTKTGEVIQHAPIIYQTINGQKQPVDGSYKIESNDRVSFKLAQYDTHRDLVIDPVLRYSTYLGGTSLDAGEGIAVNAHGQVYITGPTNSVNFHLLNEIEGDSGAHDIFLIKLDQTNDVPSILFSTYFGGSQLDWANDIALDGNGNIYVAGTSASSDFNLLNEIEGKSPNADLSAGAFDVVVVKFQENNNVPSLAFSTFLGGGDRDEGLFIALDSANNIYVTGITESTDFDLLNEIEGDSPGIDIIVFKLTQSGNVPSLGFSTYMGGDDTDEAEGIATDSSGNIYVTGSVESTDFNTLNEIEGDTPGDNRFGTNGFDIVVFKLTQVGNVPSLGFSTYLGGDNTDRAGGIAVDSSNNVYVTGSTSSTDFDLLNSIGTLDNPSQSLVFKLEQAGNVPSLAFSTVIGGVGGETGNGIALDAAGNIYVIGISTDTGFPLLNEIEGKTPNGEFDLFVYKLSQSANVPSLEFSTYLGESEDDTPFDIALDSANNVYVTGQTNSPDFDVLKTIQGHMPGSNAFVESMDVLLFKLDLVAPNPLPALNDFDGDRFFSDVLFSDGAGNVGTAIINDSSIVTTGVVVNLSVGWEINATADFNGDDKPDLLLYNTTTGEIRVVKVNAIISTDDAVVHTIDPSGDVRPRGAGDFNGDGLAEIVLYDPVTGDLSLIFLNGNVVDVIEPVGTIDVANDWTLVEIGDFNQDGKTDFLLYNTTTNDVSIMEMDGSSIVSNLVAFTLSPEWTIRQTADFNSDSISDILVTDSSDHVAVIQMNGPGVVTAYVIGVLPATVDLINAANYDLNGDADLLILDNGTGDLLTATLDGANVTGVNTVTNFGVPPVVTIHSGKP